MRKGEREVWFCSRDLREFSSRPTAKYRTGPITSLDPIKRLAATSELVQARDTADIDGELLMVSLGISEDYAPDVQCSRDGFTLFLERHNSILSSKPVDRALNEIGQNIWLQRQAEQQTEAEETEEFRLKSVEISVWTPDSVCHLIESNVAQGAYEIRRARWLVLLSESSLSWQEMDAKGAKRFLLVLERGQVLYSRQIDTEILPVPPGYRMTHEERQRSFDLMTVDRMRVVTTEIRSMVSNNACLMLRLSPTNVLNNTAMAKVFKWV